MICFELRILSFFLGFHTFFGISYSYKSFESLTSDNHSQGNRKSIADKYEYIMHGKLYKISEDDPGRASKSSVKGVKA